jgi:hypothetical protein
MEVAGVAADLIVWLDVPTLVCIWRIIKRVIRFHACSRPERRANML